MLSTVRWLTPAFIAVLVLIACGGGGDSGGSGSTTPTVSASRTSLQIDAFAQEYWYPEIINVSATGGSSGVYVDVSSSDPSVVTTGLSITSTTTATISVEPVQNKPVGTYSANVILSLYADPGGTQRLAQYTYPVTLRVHAGLAVNPTSLSLSAAQGAIAQTTLTVTPPAGTSGVLTATTVSATPWMTLTPVGTSAVQVSATTLLSSMPGAANAEIAVKFTRTGATGSGTIIVPVTFTIGPGLLTPMGHAIELKRDTPMAILTWPRNVAVQIGDGSTSNWSASSDASWLVLSTGSGTTPGTLTFTVDPAVIPALPEFVDSTATITIASPGLPSVNFSATLQKRLPYVASLTPSAIVVNSTSTVLVNGRGFTQLASPATYLQTAGLSVANVQVLSDSQLSFETSPSATGTHAIRIGNDAGINTSSAPLTVSSSLGIANNPKPTRKLLYLPGR